MNYSLNNHFPSGEFQGSLVTSLATVKLIRRILGAFAWTSAQEAMDVLKNTVGKAYDSEDPSQVLSY